VTNLTRVGIETGMRSQRPDPDPAYESVAKFIDPYPGGIKSTPAEGCRTCPAARLYGLTGRYDDPMPKLTLSSS
jgi:hypothetical protein